MRSTVKPSFRYQLEKQKPRIGSGERRAARRFTNSRRASGSQAYQCVLRPGVQYIASVKEFPISTSMAGSLLEIEPGAMRELLWYPNADEWQYLIEGKAEMAVFLAEGQVVID